MKIKFFIERWAPIIGGAEKSAERLMGALEKNNVEVEVLTRQLDDTPTFDNVERISCGKGFFGTLMFYMKSYSKLKDDDYDVLHMHGINIFSGLMAKAAGLRKSIIKTTTANDLKNVAEYRWFGSWFLKQLNNINVFVCTSKEQAKEVKKYLPGARIEYIGNGIDTEEWKRG